MTTRGIQNSLPLDFPATIPADFALGDQQRLVVPVDAPTTGYIVLGGVPYALQNGAPAPITVATADGLFLRTIDGGTTPVAIQGSTNKKIRIRLKTFKLTATGYVAVQAAVNVAIGRVTGAPDVTVGTFAKGSGIVVVGAADLSGAATPAVGRFITGTAGDLGLLDVEVTFTNTDAKIVTVEYGGTQYLLTVPLV